MSKLPDGTNPYGRFLEVMRNMADRENAAGIVPGEYLGDGRFQIGDHTFDSDEVGMIQNQIVIDSHTFVIPGIESQTHTVTKDVTIGEETTSVSFSVSVPPLEKGDTIIAYQFDDEEFVILGKVVS